MAEVTDIVDVNLDVENSQLHWQYNGADSVLPGDGVAGKYSDGMLGKLGAHSQNGLGLKWYEGNDPLSRIFGFFHRLFGGGKTTPKKPLPAETPTAVKKALPHIPAGKVAIDIDGDGVPDRMVDAAQLIDKNSPFWEKLRAAGVHQIGVDYDGDGVIDNIFDPSHLPGIHDSAWQGILARVPGKVHLVGVDYDGDGVVDNLVARGRLYSYRGMWRTLFGHGGHKVGVDVNGDGIIDFYKAGVRGYGWGGVLSSFVFVALDVLSLLSVAFSLFFIFGWFKFYRKEEYWREKDDEKHKFVPVEASSDEENPQWQQVTEWSKSDNENDWRRAIMEADVMLDDMLTNMGYLGPDLGSKLKQIEVADFPPLNIAWEAHKARNQIAHADNTYILSRREMRRVLALYEAVFKEFSLI